MSESKRPLYSLTIEEYEELNKRMFCDLVKQIKNMGNQTKAINPSDDIIFMKDVMELTGYKKATLYSKVCRYEIPILSRRNPLTFSKKAIIDWISEGKPSVIEMEKDKYYKK